MSAASSAARTSSAPLLAVLATALTLRLIIVLVSDRVTVDVLRYKKVADHVLDVSWNPYTAPRLYPYPPLWVWVEAGSGWLARHLGWSFAVLVKLPVALAELGLVLLLARMARDAGLGLVPAWLYAVHPVSLLVSGFHGQFEALALFGVLLALHALGRGRADASALALALGIAAKSFPVLLLPFLLAAIEGWRARLRYLVLALGPVALSLVPYAIDNAPALRRELFGYGGVADFGWVGLVRGIRWLSTGELMRSEARHWPLLVAVGKLVFLFVWAWMALAFLRRLLRWSLHEAALAVFLSFLGFYGAISVQYLLWVVPLGLLVSPRASVVYAAVATVALLGFYAFLAPGILDAGGARAGSTQAGAAWVIGVALVLGVSVAWLAGLVRCGLTMPGRSPKEGSVPGLITEKPC